MVRVFFSVTTNGDIFAFIKNEKKSHCANKKNNIFADSTIMHIIG